MKIQTALTMADNTAPPINKRPEGSYTIAIELKKPEVFHLPILIEHNVDVKQDVHHDLYVDFVAHESNSKIGTYRMIAIHGLKPELITKTYKVNNIWDDSNAVAEIAQRIRDFMLS